MSELNKSAWPFAGAGTEGGLDIDAIFGSSTPGNDVNPFDVSVMQEPAQAEEQSAEAPVPDGLEDAASKPSVSDATETPNSTAAAPPPNPAATKPKRPPQLPRRLRYRQTQLPRRHRI